MEVNAKASFKTTQNRGQTENSLGFVKVHDAMDNLHRGVPAEEGDLVGKLLGR